MKRELVTDWLTGNPVRIGWYDVRWTSGNIQRRWWDGAKWLCSPDGQPSFCGESYGDPFRGLTAPHAGWKA